MELRSSALRLAPDWATAGVPTESATSTMPYVLFRIFIIPHDGSAIRGIAIPPRNHVRATTNHKRTPIPVLNLRYSRHSTLTGLGGPLDAGLCLEVVSLEAAGRDEPGFGSAAE